MYYTIKLGAVTNAQRAQRLLRSNGYKATMSRLSNPAPGDGCGYVLTADGDSDMIDILKRNGINILGVESE